MENRTNGWVQALYTLVFIAIPSILMWIFLTKDMVMPIITLSRWTIILIGFGFIVYAFISTSIFILLKFVWYDMFNFTMPLAFVFMGIFMTYDLPTWSRALIVLSLVFLTFPINILTTKFTEYRIKKQK